ncbi:unnamed protein product, partial [Lymnaea stagnalis]
CVVFTILHTHTISVLCSPYFIPILSLCCVHHTSYPYYLCVVFTIIHTHTISVLCSPYFTPILFLCYIHTTLCDELDQRVFQKLPSIKETITFIKYLRYRLILI